MKQNLKVIISLLVFVAICIVAPSFLPEAIYRGIILFLLMVILIVVANRDVKKNSEE